LVKPALPFGGRRRRRLDGSPSLRRRCCGPCSRRADGLERNRGVRRTWRGQSRCRRIGEGLLEHRSRRLSSRRHYLEHEGQSEEDSGSPPRCLGENCSCLPDSDERIRRGAGAAEVRGQAASLPCLQENGCDQHNSVDDEDYQEDSIEHLDETKVGCNN
jgi:hypothetical protein